MNLYSLISCIPISTNRFTQKCDCFQNQNHSDYFFYLISTLWSRWKQVEKCQSSVESCAYFYEAKFSAHLIPPPPPPPPPPPQKKMFPRVPMVQSRLFKKYLKRRKSLVSFFCHLVGYILVKKNYRKLQFSWRRSS